MPLRPQPAPYATPALTLHTTYPYTPPKPPPRPPPACVDDTELSLHCWMHMYGDMHNVM